MQSFIVSSYRTQKRINIQTDSVSLYTNRFYVDKGYLTQANRKKRGSYFIQVKDKLWTQAQR